MKKSYKRLLVLELIILIILILNNFVSGILGGYYKPIFTFLILIIFRFFFDYEKDRHRYSKTICIEVIIYLLAYFIIYYLLGIIFSFYEPINYLNPEGLINVIIPLVLTIIITEVLRYVMLCKADGSKILFIITCILFIQIDLIGVYNITTFKDANSIFMFLALSLLPSVSKNVLCCYISHKAGYKPVIIYSLVMGLYPYLLPIIPNPNEYLYSIIGLIAPLLLIYRLYIFYKIERDEDVISRGEKHKILALVPSSIIIIILVYFTSGYFHYHAIVIGSGSMESNISKGDVVVVEKMNNNYSELKEGDIIAVKNEGVIIVHRLVKIIQVSNEYYFYTKGDANENIDSYKITEDMVYGIVRKKIPYIGVPTVWLKNI